MHNFGAGSASHSNKIAEKKSNPMACGNPKVTWVAPGSVHCLPASPHLNFCSGEAMQASITSPNTNQSCASLVNPMCRLPYLTIGRQCNASNQTYQIQPRSSVSNVPGHNLQKSLAQPNHHPTPVSDVYRLHQRPKNFSVLATRSSTGTHLRLQKSGRSANLAENVMARILLMAFM